jgi:hypothetical protein
MFAHVGIDIPIEKIMDDWDYLDDQIVKEFVSWKEVGQNVIGIRRRQITLNEIIDPVKGSFNSITMTPEGLTAKQHKGLKIHITPGGVPHRVEHSFGFWHINDMDELYLPVPPRDGETLGHFIVLMQTPSGKENESFAQFCQKCLTMLHEVVYESGKYGLAGMHAAEDEAIRIYNADAKLRHCPECGHDNPLGYVYQVAKDTPETAAARLLW